MMVFALGVAYGPDMSGAIEHLKTLPQVDLGIKHHFFPGMYAKEMLIPAGSACITHSHKFDHMSVLASGKVEVEVDGIKTVHSGFAILNILADKPHGIKALEDSVWLCVHATDETDPEKIDETLIKE